MHPSLCDCGLVVGESAFPPTPHSPTISIVFWMDRILTGKSQLVLCLGISPVHFEVRMGQPSLSISELWFVCEIQFPYGQDLSIIILNTNVYLIYCVLLLVVIIVTMLFKCAFTGYLSTAEVTACPYRLQQVVVTSKINLQNGDHP